MVHLTLSRVWCNAWCVMLKNAEVCQITTQLVFFENVVLVNEGRFFFFFFYSELDPTLKLELVQWLFSLQKGQILQDAPLWDLATCVDGTSGRKEVAGLCVLAHAPVCTGQNPV